MPSSYRQPKEPRGEEEGGGGFGHLGDGGDDIAQAQAVVDEGRRTARRFELNSDDVVAGTGREIPDQGLGEVRCLDLFIVALGIKDDGVQRVGGRSIGEGGDYGGTGIDPPLVAVGGNTAPSPSPNSNAVVRDGKRIGYAGGRGEEAAGKVVAVRGIEIAAQTDDVVRVVARARFRLVHERPTTIEEFRGARPTAHVEGRRHRHGTR